MQDGACTRNIGVICLVTALLACLAPDRATAQNYDRYYGPNTAVKAASQHAPLSQSELLTEIQARLAALEATSGVVGDGDGKVKEIDIQKKPSHKLRGRMYFDQLWMDDLEGPGGFVDEQNNQTGFDTVRLGITGNIYENIKYTAEFEFEGEEVDYKDASATLTDLAWVGNFQLGHFKEVAGLEQMTSSRFVTFMERSVPTNNFTPGRNLGIMLFNHFNTNQRWSWWAGLFRGQSADDDADVDSDSNDWAGTFRVAGLPYYDEHNGRCLLHLGAWASTRRTGEFGGKGGSGDWEGFLGLDSRDGPINVDLGDNIEFNIYAYEVAYMRGAFFIQNETFFADVPSTASSNGFDVYGTYVTVGYFLTGENRGYKKSGKSFDRVKPYEPFFLVNTSDGVAGGLGAWEIAARWSFSDLNVPGEVPGTQENVTLGLNWYLNPYSRMMLNYVHSISDVTSFGAFKGDHLGMRFQIDW